jgi:ATPase subunit of ABC transporter with duplicated ATPase domains
LGEKTTEWVKNVPQFHVPTFLEQIAQGAECLMQHYKEYGMAESTAKTLTNMGDENLLRLQEIMTEYEITIELNTDLSASMPEYRSIEKVSTGQKCTAILHLLLLENTDPLLLDQPEDHLDNAFIAERIVPQLRDTKNERQFFIATHNANIPIVGDAEWMMALEATNASLDIDKSQIGSIDKPEIQAAAARILEGGEQAFTHRREKYGY